MRKSFDSRDKTKTLPTLIIELFLYLVKKNAAGKGAARGKEKKEKKMKKQFIDRSPIGYLLISAPTYSRGSVSVPLTVISR